MIGEKSWRESGILFLTPHSTLLTPQNLQDGHILDKDGIDTYRLEVLKELPGGIEFIIVENGIDGHIDLDAEGMSVFAELADVVDTVACCRTGTKA